MNGRQRSSISRAQLPPLSSEMASVHRASFTLRRSCCCPVSAWGLCGDGRVHSAPGCPNSLPRTAAGQSQHARTHSTVWAARCSAWRRCGPAGVAPGHPTSGPGPQAGRCCIVPSWEPFRGLHAQPDLTCLELLHCVHQQLPCCLGMLHISPCSLTSCRRLHRGVHAGSAWWQAGIPISWVLGGGCQLGGCSILHGKQQLIPQIYRAMLWSCLLF